MTKIKNIFKRIIAGALVCLFVLSLLPPAEVLANPQAPVTSLVLTNPQRIGSRFQVQLNWTRPIPTAGAPGSDTTNPAATHPTLGYHVMFRDASAQIPQPYAVASPLIPDVGGDNFSHTFGDAMGQMSLGRLYAFWIRAWHQHEFPIPTVGLRPPPLDIFSDIDASNHWLFMTDLYVAGNGDDGELNLSWSAPMYGNQEIFDNFRIYFTQGPNASAANVRSFQVTVSVADLEPPSWVAPGQNPGLPDGGWVYHYTVTHPNLIPGRTYSVAVEPMIGTNVIREAPILSSVTVGGREYGLMFRPGTQMFQTNVFIRPTLSFTPIGMDQLLLRWSQIVDGMVGGTEVEEVRIFQSTTVDGVTTRTLLGTLHRGPGTVTPGIGPPQFVTNAVRDINYWLVMRPDTPTLFEIEVRGPSVGGIPGELLDMFYDTWSPHVTPFTPLRPDIVEIRHEDLTPRTIFVEWDAFLRRPFTQDEMNNIIEGSISPPLYPHGLFQDRDIVYDVWITDDLNMLFDAAFIADVNNLIGNGLTVDQVGPLSTDNTYSFPFIEFISNTPTGLVRSPIQPNRVYYVKIVARRTVDQEQVSLPSYGSYFIPPDNVDVMPPMVPAPPLRVSGTGLNHITIEWERIWFEGFFREEGETDGIWLPIALRGGRDGELIFGNAIGPNDFRFELNEYNNITDVRAALGTNQVPLRMQVLAPNTGFQVFAENFSEISDYLTEDEFENFVLILHNQEFGPWGQPITPTTFGAVTLRHTIEGLDQNTTYAIFFRPFNPQEGVAWWPTFLTGTTDDEGRDMEIDPTTPVLRPIRPYDDRLVFGLRPFSTDFTYEFRISEFPDFSTAWDPEAIDEELNYTADGLTYRRFRAENLFPETTYFIWARAIGTAERPPGEGWSNPITMQTLPIQVPPPPRGLGLASQQNVHIVNLENEFDFAPVEPDAMIITWLPNAGDMRLPIEVEDGGNDTLILGSPQISHAYMVRFPDLEANRAYYVRARTIFSITRDGVGEPAEARFDYIVQLATNPEFLDATTVFVLPDASEITHGLHTRMAMSEWTDTFIFHTMRDDGEYDWDVIPELFPLPMRDFEIIYVATTQTLTYRFRSTGVDADGHQDNLVDQRFISRLIQTRAFNYTIDMTHYNNLPVRNRIVELPYSIITAFDERQISFTVVAGDSTYSLTPGFASTPQNAGFNVNSRMRLYINDIAQAPVLPYGQSYVTTPQSLRVDIVNGANRVTLPLLAQPLNISHRVNQALMMDYNIGSYMRNPDDVAWRRAYEDFNEISNMLNFSTARPGQFAAIGIALPQQFGEMPAAVRDALYFVNSRIAFTDMDWFMADVPIDAWQINRIIAAIATNARSVNINDDLTPAQRSSLTNGGMLVPGAAEVTRESAVSALVRLYEVRTRSRVNAHPTLAMSRFADISTASANLQDAMLKAEFLGFLDGGTTANPHAPLTMGDAMIIFEIILRN